MSPHDSHTEGLNVDIRPMRIDGAHKPVSIDDENNYSFDLTDELAQGLKGLPGVRSILFNDSDIKVVRYHKGHDNHLHVSFKSGAGC